MEVGKLCNCCGVGLGGLELAFIILLVALSVLWGFNG